jgi:16S rRNA (uracil1498-N3)-methyltransferase
MQKATELGVHAIQPVCTSRTVVRLDPERGEHRMQHWQRVVISACEQCGRSRVPQVHPPLDLADAVAALPPGMARLYLDPAGEASVDRLLGAATAVALGIGPEGGFTPEERAMLVRAGFGALRLGPRILRTETAPLAALSILQFARGDLGGRS